MSKKKSKTNKPFGGAKIIYKASIVKQAIEKESVQDLDDTSSYDDIVSHPVINAESRLSLYETDAIEYYTLSIDKNSYHTRCVAILSNTTVGLGLNFSEGVEPITIKERLSNVNEIRQSFTEVISRVATDYYLTGNGYLEVVRGVGGRVEELFYMPATYVWRRVRGSDTQFYYQGPGQSEKHPLKAFDVAETEPGSSIIHFAQWSTTDRYYGLPYWRGALVDIELDYYSVLYQKGFFINNGVPDMAIIVEGGEFDEETTTVVQEFLQDEFKGPGQNNRTLYLPINQKGVTIRFERLAVESKDQDASFKNLRNTSRDNIISAHGVPPRLVGVVVAGQLGGGGEAESQLSIYQEITVSPVQELFETKLNPVISQMDIGEVGFTFTKMDTSIQEKDSEKYPKLVAAGIIPAEVAQVEMGFNPEEIKEIEDKNAEEQAKKLKAVEDAKPPEQKEEEQTLRLVENLEKINKAM